MIKIIITRKAFEDKDIGYDSQFDLNCEINVSEDATYDEAMYAWFEALTSTQVVREQAATLLHAGSNPAWFSLW